MALVAGVDSSTQSCKVVVRDAETGALLRSGRASHPSGTEVHPSAWDDALVAAIADAGGIDDVEAIAVGAQQHAMVVLDAAGEPVRPALLWNDTRSADAASALIEEFGGPAAWAEAIGVVPVASFTITKLRWLADHEPDSARRTAAVCLPHDWLTWRLRGSRDLDDLTTDRSDASGTAYWSWRDGYREDLVALAFRRTPLLPRVLHAAESAGRTRTGTILGSGAGDNAAAALGLGARRGDVVVSIGTSGVACAVSGTPVCDTSGMVASFADATGGFLPVVATLNAAQVLDAVARLLGVDLGGLSRLALEAAPGADGLVLVPYFEGERSPNKPDSTGALHGLRLANSTPANLARAAIEGVLCGLADAVDALVAQGVEVNRILLTGGGARSAAVQYVAATLFDRPVVVPAAREYVADGAARQAAWVLAGSHAPPRWEPGASVEYASDPQPQVRARYAQARELTTNR